MLVEGYVGMGGIGKVDVGEVGMEEGTRERVSGNEGEEGLTENADDVDAGADEDDDENDLVETVNVDDELVAGDTLSDDGDEGDVGGRERIGREGGRGDSKV